MLQEVEGAAVDGLLCNDVVALLSKCLDGEGDGCSTGGNRQACRTAFESGDAVFEHALGGVGKAAVDVACVSQAESIGCVLRVAEHVAGGLVDRHCAGIGSGICLFLANVQGEGVELEFVFRVVYELAHGGKFLSYGEACIA